MGPSFATALRVFAVFTWTVGVASANAEPRTSKSDLDLASYHASSIITKDVCVIGGGGSGTYAAIGLRDLGHSVVVVEGKNRLGGHTETYTDPATKATIDIGVVVWHDLPIVRDFCARLNVSLAKSTFGSASTVYESVDYRTSKNVSGYAPPDATAALTAYSAQLAKYPYLEAGFDLPDPVPADLLLPFGDFVKKYDLGGAVMTVFNEGEGLSNILQQPTLYVMKLVGSDVLRNLQTGFVASASNDNSELYQHATAVLGSDVLFQSRVVAMDRNHVHGYTSVLVDDPSGPRLIRAKKVVVAIPPKLDNLHGFDLSDSERALFGQFGNSAYYTGILRNSGIPDNVTIANVGADTAYNLPPLPAVYTISATGVPGLHVVYYGSPIRLSDQQVQADILAHVKRLASAPSTPEFVVFSAHAPFELTVPVAAIKAGFYKRLYALQGQRNTFYTGAAFHTQDSSLLWNFTQALLPKISASL